MVASAVPPEVLVPLAGRGVGVTEVLSDLLPRFPRQVFADLTHVGDGAVLLALLGAYAVLGNRRRGLAAIAILLGGFALLLGLKEAIGLPRPPMPVRLVPETGSGFPSAHAFDAVVGFGLLALLVDAGSRRRRYALAGTGAVLVAASRVVIGVHFLVDVLVGLGLGVAYLVVAVRVARWDPNRAVAVAWILALGAIVIGERRGVLVLVGALAVLLAHHLAGEGTGTSGETAG